MASTQLRPCGYADDAIMVQWIDEFQDFVILTDKTNCLQRSQNR